MKFPNKCCRCGFCCLNETCPVGQSIYQVGKYESCPGLSFDGDMAICELMENSSEPFKMSMGEGAGCCIKARAYKNGVEFDFASLSPEIKRIVVKEKRLKGEKIR